MDLVFVIHWMFYLLQGISFMLKVHLVFVIHCNTLHVQFGLNIFHQVVFIFYLFDLSLEAMLIWIILVKFASTWNNNTEYFTFFFDGNNTEYLIDCWQFIFIGWFLQTLRLERVNNQLYSQLTKLHPSYQHLVVSM